MDRNKYKVRLCMGAGILLLGWPLLASAPATDIAERILHGNQSDRLEAVKAFNALPADDQYALVPSFYAAKTDPDPEVRKIASRILKAMGKRFEGQPVAGTQEPVVKPEKPAVKETPVVKENTVAKEPSIEKEKPVSQDNWSEERKMKAAEKDQWAELKKIRAEEEADYAALQKELITEKKKQVTLDAMELLPELRNIPKPK